MAPRGSPESTGEPTRGQRPPSSSQGLALLQCFPEELIGAVVVFEYREHHLLHLCAEEK